MGFAKEQAMIIEKRGFDDIDKYVCEDCINDPYLKNWIHNNGSTDICDYCGEEKVVVSMTDLMTNVIMPTFRKYYDYAVEWLGWESAEGGYQGITYDNEEIVTDFSDDISSNMDVINDIIESMHDKLWCKKDPYGLTDREKYEYSWESFSNLVKYKNRYFFLQEEDDKRYYEKYSPLSILNLIEENSKNLNLIKKLPQNTDLYRVRIFKKGQDIVLDGANLGSPPNELAKNDRMSSSGISVFYGSENKKTCIKEVLTSCLTVDDIVITGRFHNINEVSYLDLTEINKIQLPSIFDIDKYELRETIIFLKKLNIELSRPIKELEQIEYVPTQIFAEYFKLVAKLQGIRYNSSKDTNGSCFVLFFNNEQCIIDDNKQVFDKKCELKLIDTSKYKLTLQKNNL